jgi:neutral ceramidase
MRSRRLSSSVIAALVACASAMVPTSVGASPASADLPRFRVGVARVDITPPPGPATFGHGPDAHVTNGYWTRLYCRVFVIETRATDRHAIVPCDLAAISDRLHRAVAEKVAEKSDADAFPVPATRLMLTATHTHAGPAHYFESPAYGGVGSTRQPGYDERMVEFLAGRIADGIKQAIQGLRPAAARWVHTTAWGISRNRSVMQFHANDPAFTPRESPDPLLPADIAAIDPALDVLQFEEIDDAQPANRVGPIGWLVFFGMHPTVLPSSNRLFGADADGVASRRLEARLRSVWATRGSACQIDTGCDPLAGFVNTNEGDLSPVWRRGDVAETIEIGEKLADAALRTLDPSVPVINDRKRAERFRTDLALESRYIEVDLPGRALPRGGGHLCTPPRLGQAAGHGGSDHPTSIDGLIDSGSDLDPASTDCQAPKPQLLGSFSPLIVGLSPKTFFPTHVAFALVHLGDTWLSFVPGELTVHAGAAVNRAVLDAVARAGEPAPTAIVAGLANGYIQYIATRAEYQLQAYEGASTLYGPASADFTAQLMKELALDLMGEPQPDSPSMGRSVTPVYEFAPRQHRFPTPSDPEPQALFEPLSLCSIREKSPPALCFRWTHGEPGQVPVTVAPWIELIDANGLSPRFQTALGICDPGAAIDDRGVDFQTRVRERSRRGLVWSTVFQPSGCEWAALKAGGATYRIRARGRYGLAPVTSPDFSFQNLPPRCSAAQVQYCLGREPSWIPE